MSRTPLLPPLACALAVLLLVSNCLAQPPGGPGFGGPGFGGPGFGGPGFGGPGFGGPGFGPPGGPFGTQNVSNLLTLAEDAGVWEEIKITDEQLGKVKRVRAGVNAQFRKLRDELRAQQQATFGGGAGTGSGQPPDPTAMAALRQAMRQATEELTTTLQHQTEGALRKILKPAQFTRLQQIDLQQQGPLVVVRPDVAKALNLSADQIEQAQAVIAQISTQGREQMMQSGREFFESLQNNNNNTNNGNANQPPANVDPDVMRERVQGFMEKQRTAAEGFKDKAEKQVTQILTKAQRTKFSALLGPAFDLALLNDGRGPGNSLFGFGGLPGGPMAMGPGGGPGGPAAPTTPPSTKEAGPARAKGASSTKPATKR
jgi:hypothetical protein